MKVNVGVMSMCSITNNFALLRTGTGEEQVLQLVLVRSVQTK